MGSVMWLNFARPVQQLSGVTSSQVGVYTERSDLVIYHVNDVGVTYGVVLDHAGSGELLLVLAKAISSEEVRTHIPERGEVNFWTALVLLVPFVVVLCMYKFVLLARSVIITLLTYASRLTNASLLFMYCRMYAPPDNNPLY